MTRKRTKTVHGYRIQPKLPISIGLLGAVCQDAEFTSYPDSGPVVEAEIFLGLLTHHPYSLVLSYEQALEADIIEKV